MSKTFDPKQQAVLDCELGNQLVSAGAGSGKTTVMIRKIADLLLAKKVKPSEIVVLTFTVLASHEMKQRLVKILNEELQKAESEEQNEFISSLLYEIETASIDTIDGFCSKMCKKYFFKLNLSPETSIATGLSLDYYVENALGETIRQALKSDRQAVIDLADCFEKNARNLDALKKNLLNTFNFIMAQKDYESFLNLSIQEYQGLYNSADFLNKYFNDNIKKYAIKIEKLLPDIQECKNLFDSLTAYIKVLDRINENKNIISNAKQLPFLPIIQFRGIKENCKDVANEIKQYYLHIKEMVEDFIFLALFDEEEIKKSNKHFSTYINLLKLFIDNYKTIKDKHKVVDFLDLERKFLEILNIQEIKDELLSQYKYIFVDEYQDINPMQDEIICELKSSNAKIFFVGDVKQSIYGFRQSTPELFLEKYKQYKQDVNSKSFDMNINFRSNPTILRFNNEIFSNLMTEENTDIDYKSDAQFDAKRTDFIESPQDVEIALFDNDNKEEQVATGIYSVKGDKNQSQINDDIEINFVIDKILSLVNRPFYDSNIGNFRPMEFKDIAILSRSINDSKSKKLVEQLKLHLIPINISNKTSLKECESVYLIYNILKVLNNNADDVALLTYLTTNLGGMNLNEIYTAIDSQDYETLQDKLLGYANSANDELSSKIKYAFNLIDEIRFNTLTCDNIELINVILNKYHLKHYILNSENGENELNSLNNFISTLSPKERDESLTDFLKFLKENMDSDTDYSLNDGVNTVTIQTIHASKGLEYPVVILFNASKTFKPNNYRDDINFDSELGIGMHYFDLDSRKKIDSIPRFAITTKNKIKCYKEELRLLYVATTRPKNKLIITGEANFAKLANKELNDNNFLELIYSVYMDSLNVEEECKTLKNCSFYHYNDYKITNTISSNNSSSSVNINGKNIDFEYPHTELQSISLKNNVTAISRELNEDYNILPKKLNIGENLTATTPTSADIGTSYHKALSNIDYLGKYMPQNIDGLDEKLLKNAYDKISMIARGAKSILKEAQFMMYIPYNEIYTDSEISNKVLVQGVVDLMLEFDDHIILVDYKYSQLDIDSLKEKYGTQLKLYKLAIEKAKHKKVTESFIYQINTGNLK